MKQFKIKMFGEILSLLTLTSGSIQAMELAHVDDKRDQIQVFYDKLVALSPTRQFNKQQIFHGYIKKQEISLYGGKNIRVIPTEIGLCTALEMLDLSGNKLVSLPTEIKLCTALQGLDLSDNELTSIPTEIGLCTALEMLDLSDNKLTTIPKEIGSCTSLKILSLSNNQLATIPTEIGSCTSLQDLYLSNNQLASIPTEIGSCALLRILSLPNNQLATIPAEIGYCTALQILNLSVNPRLASSFGSEWSKPFIGENKISKFRQWCGEKITIKKYMLLMSLSAEDSPIYIPKELIDVIFNIIWELQKK